MAVPLLEETNPFLILFLNEGGIRFRFHQLLEDIQNVPEEE